MQPFAWTVEVTCAGCNQSAKGALHGINLLHARSGAHCLHANVSYRVNNNCVLIGDRWKRGETEHIARARQQLTETMMHMRRTNMGETENGSQTGNGSQFRDRDRKEYWTGSVRNFLPNARCYKDEITDYFIFCRFSFFNAGS